MGFLSPVLNEKEEEEERIVGRRAKNPFSASG
jgi:hypothetical protein